VPEVKPDLPVVPKPDIALEKEEKERRAREAEEAARAEKKQRELEAKKAAELKAKADAAEKEKARLEEEKAKKLAEAKAKREAEQEEKQHDDQVKQLIAQASKASDAPRSASAQVGATAGGTSGGLDGGYAAQLISMIRSNTVFTGLPDLSGNPRAVFSVTLQPDCSITAVKLKRSSGVPSWDIAAERAIRRSDPFPKPPSGQCVRDMEIGHGPRDER
jgi:colicin import membrane protein